MSPAWQWISGIAFLFATLYLLTSATIILLIVGRLSPLLADTKNQIQDLGDLATNTVARTADTMEIVENRVSQAMGQATLAGKDATRQALGLGTVLAGVYVVSRFVQTLRSHLKPSRKRGWFRR